MNEQEIARLEEARQADGLCEITEHLRIAGGAACYGGPGSWANILCGIGLDGPVSDDDLDRIDAFYASRGVDVRAEISPYSDPALPRQLAARGFRADRFENLLARELDGAVAVDPPPGIEIRAVRPGEEALFVEVSSSGFREVGQPISAVELEIGLRMVSHPLVWSVMALSDGVPVAGASAEVRGPVAALFGASTLPEWRGRGIQGALIRARLAEAWARGARIATIGSIPGAPTERNVARQGFRVVCTRFQLVRPA
jgi:GNAT superfamily N-acetyltransferase